MWLSGKKNVWFPAGTVCYLPEAVTFFLQRVIFYFLSLPILRRGSSFCILYTLLHLVLQAEISTTPWENELYLGCFPSLNNMRRQNDFHISYEVSVLPCLHPSLQTARAVEEGVAHPGHSPTHSITHMQRHNKDRLHRSILQGVTVESNNPRTQTNQVTKQWSCFSHLVLLPPSTLGTQNLNTVFWWVLTSSPQIHGKQTGPDRWDNGCAESSPFSCSDYFSTMMKFLLIFTCAR